MSDWARIHRKFWRHRKAKDAGLQAIGLWTLCNAWSRDHRTRGFVPYDVVYELCMSDNDLAGVLVGVRLWIPAPGGFQFYNWMEWNADDQPKGMAGELIDQFIPRIHPQVMRGALEKQVSILLDEGTDTDTMELALKKWLTKPNAGAGVLPFLVSDVLRERTEDDLAEIIREAHESGDLNKLARRGLIFTPSDDCPNGLTVPQMRAHNLADKRKWLKKLQEDLIK